jgi:hypothetical protein
MNPASLGAVKSQTTSATSPRIFRVEDHDGTLPVWRNSAGTGRILIHVNTHDNMWWAGPQQKISISNFREFRRVG